MALTTTPPGELGQACPDFRLPATDGQFYSRPSLSSDSTATKTRKPFVVMFICNHCPYVKAIEDRLIQLGHDLQAQQIPVYAISSNDVERYPADSFAAMKVLAEEKKYSFPYLFDEDQSVARAFGAVCTPDFFVYDRAGLLAYRGRLDDSWKDPARVTQRELYEAVLKLDQGLPAPSNPAPSMGCSLKWKTQ